MSFKLKKASRSITLNTNPNPKLFLKRPCSLIHPVNKKRYTALWNMTLALAL